MHINAACFLTNMIMGFSDHIHDMIQTEAIPFIILRYCLQVAFRFFIIYIHDPGRDRIHVEFPSKYFFFYDDPISDEDLVLSDCFPLNHVLARKFIKPSNIRFDHRLLYNRCQ